VEKIRILFFVLTTLAISLFLVMPHIAIGIESLQKDTGKDAQLKFSFVRKWGSNGTGPGHFVRPHDVAFDSKGYVYVSDRELDNIQKFSHNGTFIKMWGSRGSGDGQFNVPYSLGID
jgi:hypothetical protein